MTLNIVRNYERLQTTGFASLLNDKKETIFTFRTLELPWLNNQNLISCIPRGSYKVVPRHSAKYRNHFHVLNVPSRDFILIHSGNFVSDSTGCILVGAQLRDLNKDGLLDVTDSLLTLYKLVNLLPNPFKLIIS